MVRQLVASGRVCCWSGAVQCGGSWSHTLPRAVDEPVRPVLDAPLSLARVAAFGLSACNPWSSVAPAYARSDTAGETAILPIGR